MTIYSRSRTCPRVSRRDGTLSLSTPEPHRVLPVLLKAISAEGGELTALSTHHATLDDVFLERTGRQLREA